MPEVEVAGGLALVLGICLALRWMTDKLWLLRRKWSFFAANGCHEAPCINQRQWFFGLDVLYDSYKHVKQHEYLDLLQDRFKTYGNTFQSHQFGTTTISTIEPVNIEAIVKRSNTDYLARPARAIPLDGLVGHGILTADGDVWKRHRSMMKPSFHKKRLEQFSVYEEHIRRLIDCMPPDGQPVNLQDLFFGFTIDTSTAHLFGSSSRLLDAENSSSKGPELANAFNRAQRASVEKFALGWADRLRPQPQYVRDTQLIHKFADQYIEDACEARKGSIQRSNEQEVAYNNSEEMEAQMPRNVLEEFLRHTDDPEEIRAGLLNLMVAGRDTTASLLSNLWHCLSRNHEVWRRLQVEIATLAGDRPSAESLRRLPYLRQCIDEGMALIRAYHGLQLTPKSALRCHPPIPFSIRIAARDTILPTGGGQDRSSPIYVREGTLIIIALYNLHRDPEVWGPDAREFRPARWDSFETGSVPAYMPFLAGPRKCLGWELAINTAAYVTVRLMQEFSEVQTADDCAWEEELGLSVTSKNGVRVFLTHRKGGS
jgi:cytochrome P450